MALREATMGWKIYAAIAVVLFLSGAWDELTHPAAQSLVAWLNLAVGAVALLGLLAFAFRKRLGAARLWLVVLIAFVLVNVLAVWEMLAHTGAPVGSVQTAGLALALIITLALTVPTGYALYAYARRLSAEGRET